MVDIVEIPLRNPSVIAGLELADERMGKAHVDAVLERLLLHAVGLTPLSSDDNLVACQPMTNGS